jgi:hypothetical protein
MMTHVEDLRDWIRQEMTVSEEDILGLHRERVGRILGVTSDGRVFFRINKNRLDAESQIGAYLIGKLFARIVGYSEHDTASNQELTESLRMPAGTVRGTLSKMRDKGTAEAVEKGLHRVPINSIPRLLEIMEEQLK